MKSTKAERARREAFRLVSALRYHMETGKPLPDALHDHAEAVARAIIAGVPDKPAQVQLHKRAASRRGMREHVRKVKRGEPIRTRSGKDLPVGRPRKPVDAARVRQMRAEGVPWAEIARTLGIAEKTARKAIA